MDFVINYLLIDAIKYLFTKGVGISSATRIFYREYRYDAGAHANIAFTMNLACFQETHIFIFVVVGVVKRLVISIAT